MELGISPSQRATSRPSFSISVTESGFVKPFSWKFGETPSFVFSTRVTAGLKVAAWKAVLRRAQCGDPDMADPKSAKIEAKLGAELSPLELQSYARHLQKSGGGQLVVLGPGIAQCFGAEDDQRGAQALAAAVDDVLGDLSYQHDFGMQAVTYDMIDGSHVRAQEFVELLEVQVRATND